MVTADGKTGMGWIPDYPDIRDYTDRQADVKKVLSPTGVTKVKRSLQSKIDLRPWCSPIENQLSIGSCTAHAGAGVVEYYEKRAFGKYLDASRLFLYKVTRNLLHWTGDTGAFLKTTMGAMVLFGVPPEEYWPYKISDFDKEPTAFCYSFAQNYQAIKYYRHDPPGTPPDELLNRVKTYLAAGHPVIFGFTVYSSIDQADTTGKIPFPAPGEKVEGGHAIVAVGYDDKMKIKNTTTSGKETTGALLIRNSWGKDWGDSGYGWLPYEYVLTGLADDFWSLLKKEWIDTGIFSE